MKSIYHITYSSHGEVLCRCDEDAYYFANMICLAAEACDTRVLVYHISSDHAHIMVETGNSIRFSRNLRLRYTKHFNHKYHRKGRIGDKLMHIDEITGESRMLRAITYILCNAVHHHFTTDVFDYPHNSINALFRKELGKDYSPEGCHYHQKRQMISAHAPIPDYARIVSDGHILPWSFVEVKFVENRYISSKRFTSLIGRKCDDEFWKEFQKETGQAGQAGPGGNIIQTGQAGPGGNIIQTGQDGPGRQPARTALNTRPISAADMEQWMTTEEYAEFIQKADIKNKTLMTDFEICHVIDTEYTPMYGCQSYCQLTKLQKSEIFEDMIRRFPTYASQLNRCLGR